MRDATEFRVPVQNVSLHIIMQWNARRRRDRFDDEEERSFDVFVDCELGHTQALTHSYLNLVDV